jgi:hypothetical protein
LKSAYCIALKPITFLLQSEETDESAVQALATMIQEAGVWTAPIPVERTTGIIMDGNHRASVAARLGLHYVPCVPLDYEDPRVAVTHWRTDAPFSVEQIFDCVLNGGLLLPYKTTRHRFAPNLPRTDIPLCVLRGVASHC